MWASKKEEQSRGRRNYDRPRRNLTVSSSSAQASVRAQLHFLFSPPPQAPLQPDPLSLYCPLPRWRVGWAVQVRAEAQWLEQTGRVYD